MVVAPVLRFKDVGFNAKVTVEELGTPDMLISGFAPELFGTPLNDEDVLDTRVVTKGGQPYYEWCVLFCCVSSNVGLLVHCLVNIDYSVLSMHCVLLLLHVLCIAVVIW